MIQTNKIIMLFCFFPYFVFSQFSDEPNVKETSIGDSKYSIWYGCNHTAITKPLIVIEGFDPNNDNDYSDIYSTIKRQDLALHLRQDGYDIIGLDFFDGRDFIENNAGILKQLIQNINTELTANNSKHEIVIVGLSMGGLVARYALAEMEKNKMT